jgi:hypothetical protein
VIYKKLSPRLDCEDDVLDVQNEVIDRFGKYPLATAYLFEIMKLRVMLKKLLVRQIDFSGRTIVISFISNAGQAGYHYRHDEKRAEELSVHAGLQLVCALQDTSFEGILTLSKNVIAASPRGFINVVAESAHSLNLHCRLQSIYPFFRHSDPVCLRIFLEPSPKTNYVYLFYIIL